MTIMSLITITCECHHVFDLWFPKSITSWLNPEKIQTLITGGYRQATCPECGTLIIIKGEILVNTPKGMATVSTYPLEKHRDILFKLDIVDESGNLSQELVAKIPENTDDIEDDPLLKKQREVDLKNYIKKATKLAREIEELK
jgi:hypothetical protein